MIDLYSRFVYAKVVKKINTHETLKFVQEAEKEAGFKFMTIQSDHGPEFSAWFTENIRVMGIAHCHSRVRQANDNSHIKRFNRTIQEKCLDNVPQDVFRFRKAIKEYLDYYNGRRMHMEINFLTPLQKLAETIPSY